MFKLLLVKFKSLYLIPTIIFSIWFNSKQTVLLGFRRLVLISIADASRPTLFLVRIYKLY